jgi:hypothetical protein
VKFDRIEVVSDEMRELIEEQWPDIAAALPPNRSRAD